MAYLTSGRDKIMGSSVSTDANVVTVIDATSTDEQVPSALATKAYVDSKYDLVESYSKDEVDNLLNDKANTSDIIDAYTKDEVNNLLDAKADTNDIIDSYTKDEVNDLLDTKVNVDDLVESYSKDEIDTLLADKANATDTYNKTEIDALLDGKANTDDVTTNAYTKDEVDNLLANKADSSAIVDAYNKEEVDNLLTAKADATALDDYVLSDELDNYALTSSVYNKTEVDDLLTAKVDTTSVVTTLSSTNVDEEIPSAKAVYDAIQNVSAGVPADVYSKTEIDNLLDAKADTDAIIDAYNKTEVDDLLADKANATDIVDAYTKDEVDNLLTNKADTSDIIDSYTKDEVDNLLDGKANTDDIIDAYDKTEVDGLLANKVDTDDLVDSYSKTEVDDLLTNKANTSAIIDAYTKGEVDTLLTGKADSDDLNNIYTKEEVDNLLDSKADSDSAVDAYTKTEVDGLLANKANTTALDGKIDKTAIVTSVSSTSTDEEIPSAKAVHTAIQNLSGGVSTEQLEQAIQEAKTELENEITNIPIVTKTSDLTNDSGFITANDIPEVDLEPYALKTEIPTTLPASDVHDWAKASTKPTYTASEVGALASNGTAVNASKVSNALTLQIAGTTKNTFNGSSAQTFNIPNASTSAAGVMTTAQVTKLNGIATGATKNTVDTAMSSTSTNAVQNKVIYAYIQEQIQNQLKNAGDYVGKTMIDVGGADAGTSNGYTYTNSKGGFADITLWSNHSTDNNLRIIVDGVTVMSSARPSTSLKRVDTSGDYEVYELKIPFTSTFNITHYGEEEEYEYSIVRGFIYVNK